MGDVVAFRGKHDRVAMIEYMYAPEIDDEHPYAFRIMCENPDNGVWLSREEYIALVADLVDQLTEELQLDRL